MARLLFVVLLLVPAFARAQRVDYKRESPAVAVLRAVMLYRIEHLDDRRTIFNACRAYAALGRPADFLVSEYSYYHELLDRKHLAGCDTANGPLAVDSLPAVWIDSLNIIDSIAEVRVTVIRGGPAEEWRHEEVYTVRRGFRPPSRPAGLWYVARVELSSSSRALLARRRRSP